MGGSAPGAWPLRSPDKWAAIVPICGGGDTKQAAKIKDIPCWCFHGDADKAVNVEGSRKMIAALKEAGGQPKYTEYPGVGHNSWDQAYGTDELYELAAEAAQEVSDVATLPEKRRRTLTAEASLNLKPLQLAMSQTGGLFR